jgi:hypothetical protein
MALKKQKKYPRKPKQTASVSSINAYFQKCAAIDRENAAIKRENDATIAARKKLASFTPGKSKATGLRKRRPVAKKAKKAAKRKRR